MKSIKFILTQNLCATLMLSASLFTACTNDIELGKLDESNYTTNDGILGYTSDNNGKRLFTNVEFRSEGNTLLYLKTSHKSSTASTATVAYDLSALDAYNSRNESNYEAFPKELVVLDANGIFTLNAGEFKSSAVKVTYRSNGSLATNKSYVIPLRIKVSSGVLQLKQEEEVRLIFVKDLTGIPDCNKESGVKVFSCMEINDTNPLNNLSFTLKKSGKPLVDALILFSANINYNPNTGRVYIYNNENVQALLDNREHYLKPLQDRGIKIILGLLGNHDCSGLANLSKETAQAFALEIKAMCDAFQLDGVFMDDEWSKYETGDNITPGFEEASNDAAARLCYETKKVQPDRWMVTFVWGDMGYLPDVDGVKSGEFVDYALCNYSGESDLSENYPGMPKSNMGMCSQEFSTSHNEQYRSEEDMRKMRADGYLSNMMFAMDPNRSNFISGQLPAMQTMARAFYDDELVFDGIKYPRDWK